MCSSIFASWLATDLSTPAWWRAFAQTLAEAVAGCATGGVSAYSAAIMIHRYPLLGAATQPYIAALQAIPAIALAPLLVLWVGYGFVAIVVLCALMVFFPVLVTTSSGLRHLDRDLLDAARLDGATPWQSLGRVELPLALPATLAGLRTGFTLSVTGAVVGEMVMGGDGLGALLTVRRDALNTAGLFAVIVVLALMAALIYGLLHWWERRSRLIEALD